MEAFRSQRSLNGSVPQEATSAISPSTRTRDIITTAQYNDRHEPTSITVNGKVTTIQRDGNGNPTSVTTPFGETYAYNPDGTLQSHTGPDGGTTSYTYDSKKCLLL